MSEHSDAWVRKHLDDVIAGSNAVRGREVGLLYLCCVACDK